MINQKTVKIRTQKYILAGSAMILAGKFTAYLITNSAGIYTDALESIVNVIAGAISLFCIIWGAKPGDKDHPFGHGKIELISSSAEGLMISVAGITIIIEGIRRLVTPCQLESLDAGIIIVSVSGLANWIMGSISIRTGKKYGSDALVSSGKHLQSDTWSTIGLVAGLVLVIVTDIQWIDSLLAILFGGLIIATGVSILHKSIDNLLDKADAGMLADFADTLDKEDVTEWIDIHNTKVTKYGNLIHMDCDITVPWYLDISQGHKLGKKLEKVMKEHYGENLTLNIHLDPCNIYDIPPCSSCRVNECPTRRESFKGKQRFSINSITGDNPKEITF